MLLRFRHGWMELGELQVRSASRHKYLVIDAGSRGAWRPAPCRLGFGICGAARETGSRPLVEDRLRIAAQSGARSIAPTAEAMAIW